VPPFQAPDEPDHFLSYAQAVGAPRLADEAAAWSRLGHHERIKFHTEEAFRPADVGNPFPVAWSAEVFADNTEARSPTTYAIWKTVAHLMTGRSAPRSFLGIRLVHALLFALAVGLAALLLMSLPAGSYPQLAVLPVLLVPTLPFFAMHVSEFGPLTSFYVLLAAALLALLLDTPRAHLVGFPLGLACALVFASGRSAGPAAIVASAILVARIVLGSRRDDGSVSGLRDAAAFWVACAAGSACFLLLATPAYRVELSQITGSYAGLAWARAVSAAVSNNSIWIFPASVVAFLAEVGLAAVRQRYRSAATERLAMWIGYGAAAALLVGLALSVVVTFPTLGLLEVPHPPTLRHYLRDVLTVMSTSFRFGHPDYLLVTTFFAGFGWLDTFPGEWLVSVLVLASGLAAVSLLAHLARTRDTRRLFIVVAATVGLAGMLLLNAAATHGMVRNLHGRYLIGWYAVLLGLAWSAAVLLPIAQGRLARVRIPRTAWLLTACGAVHAYCLAVILHRYF
ncbi:MAG: hypothetical protein Q7V01_00795, partial [Vicinamibacterales bacterium]|nr:hypothetical protein [Vicinamibacterales bacterium]